LYGGFHRRKGDLLASCQRRPQGVLHGGLVLSRCQLENLQVLACRSFLRVLAAQSIVGHAKITAGEQILPIDVVGKGTGLADQRVDDVPVIDGMFAAPRQPWHAPDEDPRMPYFHFLDAYDHIHLVADQAAMYRVRVPQNPDRAARSHHDVG
jgi:hypothetical protein